MQNTTGWKRTLTLCVAGVLLAGCETASQVGSMSQAGMSGFSCQQIDSAFSAYDRDRTSMDAWIQLVALVRPDLDATAYAQSLSESDRYAQAKAYTDLALAIKGCRPMQTTGS